MPRFYNFYANSSPTQLLGLHVLVSLSGQLRLLSPLGWFDCIEIQICQKKSEMNDHNTTSRCFCLWKYLFALKKDKDSQFFSFSSTRPFFCKKSCVIKKLYFLSVKVYQDLCKKNIFNWSKIIKWAMISWHLKAVKSTSCWPERRWHVRQIILMEDPQISSELNDWITSLVLVISLLFFSKIQPHNPSIGVILLFSHFSCLFRRGNRDARLCSPTLCLISNETIVNAIMIKRKREIGITFEKLTKRYTIVIKHNRYCTAAASDSTKNLRIFFGRSQIPPKLNFVKKFCNASLNFGIKNLPTFVERKTAFRWLWTLLETSTLSWFLSLSELCNKSSWNIFNS